MVQRACALEADLALGQRPGREVHVRVVEAGQHAAALEVDAQRVRGRVGAMRPFAIASRSTTGAAGSRVRIVPPSRRMGRIGRYSITKRRKDVEREVASQLRVRLRGGADMYERFNVAPTQDVPAVVQDRHGRRSELLRWGSCRGGRRTSTPG